MSSDVAQAESVQFQPERTHILAGIIMLAMAIILIGWAPQYLFWTLAVPLLFIYWVLRAKTTVGEDGINITYGFRRGHSLAWDELAGVGFKGARALATSTEDKTYAMPGVTFNSLPRLAEASRGRIPDVLTAGRVAADDKVVIMNKEGEQILLTKEEYAARQTSDNDDSSRSNQ